MPAATATIASPATSAPSFGTAAKLMPRISAPTSSDGQDAAEVVDGVGRLVHVGRDEPHGQHERHDGERQRDQEDRAPPEVLEQQAREQRAERRDRAADARPQRDRLGPSRARTTAP